MLGDDADDESAAEVADEVDAVDELADAEESALSAEGNEDAYAAGETSFEDAHGDTGTLPRDDLKLIKGVGPAIEKTLNEMGIFRFHQIAEMSEYDIDRIAHRLKGFRSRIYREDWMGQARELLLQEASG